MKNFIKRGCLFFIFVAMAFATTTGPNLPTAATGNTNTIGGGTVAWTNPQNIELADGVFATCIPGTAITDDLRGGGFGFAIAGTDTINGITLEISGKAATGGLADFHTVVLEGGGGASANRAAGTLTTVNTVFTFGGPADLWGTTWTPAQVNNAAFVANATWLTNGAGPGVEWIDFFRVTITSSSAGGQHHRSRRVFRPF